MMVLLVVLLGLVLLLLEVVQPTHWPKSLTRSSREEVKEGEGVGVDCDADCAVFTGCCCCWDGWVLRAGGRLIVGWLLG